MPFESAWRRNRRRGHPSVTRHYRQAEARRAQEAEARERKREMDILKLSRFYVANARLSTACGWAAMQLESTPLDHIDYWERRAIADTLRADEEHYDDSCRRLCDRFRALEADPPDGHLRIAEAKLAQTAVHVLELQGLLSQYGLIAVTDRHGEIVLALRESAADLADETDA